jgi:drug/metabolite transporter (DMT)-like permease
LLTALVWGATFVLVKSALDDASPLLFNFLRMLLAAAALALVNRRHLRGLNRTHLRDGALIGLFLALGYELQTVGLARTTAAKSAFITGLVVIFVPALTLLPGLRPQGTRRPGWSAAAGAVFAFAGLILLTTPPASNLKEMVSTISLGDWLTLGCALAFAGHLLMLAHCARTLPAGLLATLQISAAAVIMLVALPLEPMRLHLTPRLGVALLICSLLATAAAFTIQTYAQQHLPPTHTVLLLTLEPVFAWLTSLLVLHQGLDRRALTGAALIFAGILVTELIPSTQTSAIPA